MSGGFLALTIALDGLDAESVENCCFAHGAQSIAYTDARDDAILEPQPGEVRLWPATRVQALFDGASASAALIAALAADLGINAARIDVQFVAHRAWEREWLRDFRPMRFGRRLWICPRHEHVTAPGAKVVYLDPGLAFGTGTHASTALCLEWLDEHFVPGWRVIDYGCGSGILTLAAARLGAASVDAFDIDPQALSATRENSAVNALDRSVRVCRSEAELPCDVDLLMANILAGPLCELAAELVARLRAGAGRILLAGLLEAQALDVQRAYAPWLALTACGRRDGWVALTGQS